MEYKIRYKIFVLVLLQVAILVALFLFNKNITANGKDILIQATSYDPRDVFFGNYVSLNYELENNFKYVYKEKSYAILKQDGKIYKIDKVTNQKPKSGIFIAGYNRKFGIERYYLPKDKALEVEANSMKQEKILVHLKVSNSGTARIIKLELKNKIY